MAGAPQAGHWSPHETQYLVHKITHEEDTCFVSTRQPGPTKGPLQTSRGVLNNVHLFILTILTKMLKHTKK